LWAAAVVYIIYYLYFTLTYQTPSLIYFVYFVPPRGLKAKAPDLFGARAGGALFFGATNVAVR
jgi:hypothetical protein